MYEAVTYLFVIPFFSRGPWSRFLSLWFGVSPFVLFPSFFFTRISCLAPMAHTLLGGLEHAVFKFFVVAARLYLMFCVFLNFEDLAKQRRKILGGFLRSEKRISLFILVGCASFSWFFYFSLLRSRT